MLAGVFAGIFVLLALGYGLFLRPDYTLLYADLKPAEASAIVEQLEAKGIAHQLRDGGTTIMVPTAEADSVRLAVAGSDLPMKGAVGFELFNKSDMGLTDFAQKINYQRALQGELTRTITMMDGIDTARVHLAIPERSLFRGNRSTPKAAVEVIARPGRPLTPERVTGIQQLVAAAVPDLNVGEVTILDGEGKVVSSAPAAPAYANAEMEEQSAAQNYFAARAKAAIGTVLPGLKVAVRAFVAGTPATGVETGLPDARAGVDGPAPGARPGRSFPLRLTVLTEAAINAEDQAVARTAIVDAVGLDEGRGDSLAFEVGPTEPVAPTIVPAAAPSPVVSDASIEPVAGEMAPGGPGTGWYVALAALLLVVAMVVHARRRARGAGEGASTEPAPTEPALTDRDTFVARLRAGLAAERAGRP